ncbi:anthranilate synthase component I family protein [Alicyclobacillus kakegawensis]|uniref:anthranilate synthase component I family protein n=1 Tax=Alicyclobacillus kakegawensis TaxID=392012 RepID=UPI00082D02C8|nr:anthranilate synthase component I family protein [Alicyclobacillus kakegawensis]
MKTQRLVAYSVDPFYAYVDLVRTLGEGRAFLLDAAADADKRYGMSLLGALPILEIQAKDGRVDVLAVNGLREAMRDRLVDRGFQPESLSVPLAPSVLGEERLSYRPADVMELFDALRMDAADLAGTGDAPFSVGLLGYMGYDAVRYLERIPYTVVDDRKLPDVRFQWHAMMLRFDGGQLAVSDCLDTVQGLLDDAVYQELSESVAWVRSRVESWLECPPRLTEADVRLDVAALSGPTRVYEDMARTDYEEAVRRAVEYIRAGDVFQVVPSRRVRIDKQVHHYAAYDALRRLNPSPYMFMVEYPSYRLFGASPEVQFRALNRWAEMKPIAGTSKGRGRTQEEDERLRQQLLADEKERAEHVMLVDLCRNDLGRVCEVGSVAVNNLLDVEAYSHLLHLVSTVRGRIRPEVSIFHALLATFPAGTLSGAPKIRAMEIIDELEELARGPYGGMIGMVDFAGNANLAIFIRSVVEWQGQYHVQVGAGIVADSIPTEEWRETGRKAGAILDVLTAHGQTLSTIHS